MASNKCMINSASENQCQKEWTDLIDKGLQKVASQGDSYDKIQTLYERWREAQTIELDIWGKSSEGSVWCVPKNEREKYKTILNDEGTGYIPISQFDDWGQTFRNNECLRDAMLKTFIPAYITPDEEKDDKGAGQCLDWGVEKEIWKGYHQQEHRILIISREAALYNDKMKRGGRDGIPYWAICEAYSFGALRMEYSEVEGLIRTLEVEDDFRNKEYPLESRPSLHNAWLRKVSRANRPEIPERDKRATGGSAARNVLLAAYLGEAENVEKRKERAYELLREIYPKSLSNFSKSATYDEAFNLLSSKKITKQEKSPNKEKWIESLYDKIAYMTINKRGGSSNQKKSRGRNVLLGYIERYHEFLLEEISLYDPVEIVIYGLEIWEWLNERKTELANRWKKELDAEGRSKHEVVVYGFPHWAGSRGKENGLPRASYLYKIDQFIKPSHCFSIDLAD